MKVIKYSDDIKNKISNLYRIHFMEEGYKL